ncbi:unnamed protein product [Brassica oleracea]
MRRRDYVTARFMAQKFLKQSPLGLRPTRRFRETRKP